MQKAFLAGNLRITDRRGSTMCFRNGLLKCGKYKSKLRKYHFSFLFYSIKCFFLKMEGFSPVTFLNVLLK